MKPSKVVTAGNPSTSYPLCVCLFSGKRKSGKDYITDLLLDRIGSQDALIIKISSPIKSHWAKINGLDLERLMGASEYKEQFRLDMIKWSEGMRAKDPGYFCREAVSMYQAETKPIWIVSDIRRRTDIAWFRETYGDAVKTIRVAASKDVRVQRGYVFAPGVDDQPSECDLDGYLEWDWEIKNNGGTEDLQTAMQPVMDAVKNALLKKSQ